MPVTSRPGRIHDKSRGSSFVQLGKFRLNEISKRSHLLRLPMLTIESALPF
jgi:hypothetical protein